MSRIGKLPVAVPAGTDVSIKGSRILLKGPRGALEKELPEEVSVKLVDGLLNVSRADDTPRAKAMHGLWRSLINNMVVGVTEGFSIRLELNGTGYRAQLKGKDLELAIGFSHVVPVQPLGDNVFAVEKAAENENVTRIIVVSGPSKEEVGHQAAVIRKLRKPNVYTGIGIKYADERIRRKQGKTTAGTK